MRQAKAILQRADGAARRLAKALGPLWEALFPASASCPSCGRKALWIEAAAGKEALCLGCRRALMDVFRWEDGTSFGQAQEGLPCVRGRLVQCAALPEGLSSALALGGALLMGQAASAVASMIPLPQYLLIDGVFAQAGESHGKKRRVSTLAKAIASAFEAEFLGVVPNEADGLPLIPGAVTAEGAKGRVHCRLIVVMHNESGAMEEETVRRRLSGSRWLIFAYVGALWQGGGDTVI